MEWSPKQARANPTASHMMQRTKNSFMAHSPQRIVCGRRGGFYLWFAFACNNIGLPAREQFSDSWRLPPKFATPLQLGEFSEFLTETMKPASRARRSGALHVRPHSLQASHTS